MSKIQITTVKKLADVQVIELNARFVVKVTQLAAKVNKFNEDACLGFDTGYNEDSFTDLAEFFNELLEGFTGEEHPTMHVVRDEDHQPGCEGPAI